MAILITCDGLPGTVGEVTEFYTEQGFTFSTVWHDDDNKLVKVSLEHYRRPGVTITIEES